MSNASCRTVHSIPVQLSARVLRLLHSTGKGEGSIEPEGVESLSPVSEGVGPLAPEGVGSTELRGLLLRSSMESRGREKTAHTWT